MRFTYFPLGAEAATREVGADFRVARGVSAQRPAGTRPNPKKPDRRRGVASLLLAPRNKAVVGVSLGGLFWRRRNTGGMATVPPPGTCSGRRISPTPGTPSRWTVDELARGGPALRRTSAASSGGRSGSRPTLPTHPPAGAGRRAAANDGSLRRRHLLSVGPDERRLVHDAASRGCSALTPTAYRAALSRRPPRWRWSQAASCGRTAAHNSARFDKTGGRSV